MSRSRVVPILIAVLAVSALGVTATSLEKTLTTDPDEEINPDWDRLPISVGDAAAIKEEMSQGEGDESSASGANDAGDGEAEGSQGDGEEGGAPLPDTDVVQEPKDSDEQTGGIGFDPVRATTAAEPSLLDTLRALLMTILRVLVPILVMLALAALAYRYRGKLRSLLGLESPDEATTESVLGSETWPGADPSNVVDRAWVTMVRRVDPEHPEMTTTAECRTLARDRSLDVEAVDSIATAFERVHYGGVAIADEADRAREGLRRLDGGTDD